MLRKFTIFIFINDNLYYFSKRGSLGTTTDNSFIEDAYFPSIYSSPNSQQHFILIIFKNINRIFHETDAHLLPFYARRAGEIIKFFFHFLSLSLQRVSEWKIGKCFKKFLHYGFLFRDGKIFPVYHSEIC